jgi:hypothetical protein
MSPKSAVRVFLGGEGKNELGSRAGHPAYQSDESPGAIQALLKRIEVEGWEVGGARQWKDIRKYKALPGSHHDDMRNVIGLVLDAKENQCAMVAFMRDQDADEDREQAIEQGIAKAREIFQDAPDIVGRAARPNLEGWILALNGERGTESLRPKQAVERAISCRFGNTEAIVSVIERADLGGIPTDAVGLRSWIDSANQILPRLISGER